MSKVTFPVTITGMNITERGVAGKYGPQDKAGITIQQTNVIDENGLNIVIPAGAWLNGFTPQGALDQVSVGSTIEIQVKTKAKPDGTFYYNFAYYPTSPVVAPAAVPVAQAAPVTPVAQPVAPAPAPEVTRQEFDALVQTVAGIKEEMDF